MSLQGMMTLRGSTIDIYRPMLGRTASGGSKTTWPDSANTAGVMGWVEPMTAELAERVFGTERRAKLRALFPIGTDIQEHDGLKVTAGNYSGKKYQVLGPITYDTERRIDHIEVALLETTEAF